MKNKFVMVVLLTLILFIIILNQNVLAKENKLNELRYELKRKDPLVAEALACISFGGGHWYVGKDQYQWMLSDLAMLGLVVYSKDEGSELNKYDSIVELFYLIFKSLEVKSAREAAELYNQKLKIDLGINSNTIETKLNYEF